MIQKLQKFFRTDRILGRMFFIILTYVIFWCVFYGSWLFFSNTWDIADYDIYHNIISIILLLLYIIIPILSFVFFPRFFKKILIIKNPYVTNLIFMILSLSVFTYIEILISAKHWFSF